MKCSCSGGKSFVLPSKEEAEQLEIDVLRLHSLGAMTCMLCIENRLELQRSLLTLFKKERMERLEKAVLMDIEESRNNIQEAKSFLEMVSEICFSRMTPEERQDAEQFVNKMRAEVSRSAIPGPSTN